MSASGGIDVKKYQRDTVRENLVQLLQENKGKLWLTEIWQTYNQKFRTSMSKKDLGVNKMSDVFAFYPEDFQVTEKFVMLKSSPRVKPVEVKNNVVQLLKENKGRLGLGEIWAAYNRKFRTSVSKKDLGVNKMNDLFADYPAEFELDEQFLILKTYKGQDKYGMPLPSPIKPLWGAAAAQPPFVRPGQGATAQPAASSVHSTPQRGRTPPKTRPAGRPAPSTSEMSISVSSSETDSDSDSDVKITGQDPPEPRPDQKSNSDLKPNGDQKASGDQNSSGFLSFDVNASQQQDSFDVTSSRQREPMVFTNQNQQQQQQPQQQQQKQHFQERWQEKQQQQQFLLQHPQQYLQQRSQAARGPGKGAEGGVSLADLAGGRGRALDAMGQLNQPQPRPLIGMQFPMPLQPQGAGRGQHPGIMAAMAVQNQNQHPDPFQQQRQSRSRMSSESDSSTSGVHPPIQPQPVIQPRAPPPPEPTWPPNNPKLGVPPGVPRERKQVTVTPVPFHRGRLTKEQVEAVAEDCIEMLVEAGDYVSPSRIIQLLLQRYNIRDLRDLQVHGVRYPYNITCINEHERLLSKVNAAIEAFVLSRSMCTLYDLEQSLLEFSPGDKTKFEGLRLGPLQCLPIVYEKFKFPQDEKIPDISTADVLEVLSEYLSKQNKWTAKLEMEEVMAYFVDYYHVNTAYSLGIRIRSLPLAAQVLKKSHRDSANTRQSVVNRCMATVQDEVNMAFQKVKATMFQTVQTESGENVELRRHYFGMHAEAVMLELLEKYRLLLSIDTPTTRNERKRHTNIEHAINQFFLAVQSEPLGRALLHLAVCVGRLDLQEAAMELLAPKEIEEKPGDSAEGSKAEQQKARQPPSKASLMDKVKRYVERCLAQGTLTLSHLDRIEEKLLEDCGFPTFVAMGFGRFLHFLLHDPAPKALLDECGGVSLGGSHHQTQQGRAHMTEVLEFIRQCKAAAITQESDVDRAMCHQFQVTEARLLGYGNMRHLVEAAEKPGKHHSKDYRILYETAFCGKTSEPIRGKREVGILGPQTREAALACLQSCPLLEDLERWSHWSLVFEPQHGSLKDFLQKYGGVHTMHVDGGQKTITTDIVALETEPGCLLRLVSTTSPSQFESAASQGDARAACGHLASLVMGNRGIEHTPMALLANHTRSALFMLHTSSSGVPGGPGQPATGGDPAIQFVLNSLLLLPLRLCVAVANQVFLEPLAQVVGSSRSKTLLLEACSAAQTSNGTTPTPTSGLRQMELARLGCMLGVQEWTRPLTDTFTFPPECITVVMPQQSGPKDKLLGDDDDEFEEEVEEESEEESEEEEDSSASFLSDEEDEKEEKKEKPTKEKEGEKEEEVTEKLAVANKEEEESSEEETDDSSEEEGKEEDGDEKMEEKGKKEKAQRKKTIDDSGINADDKVCTSDSDSKEEIKEETEEDRCQRIINHIRRDEFGVGVELNEDGHRLMRVQQERLGRSLDRLSRDLYSKDTHFVLELVQNADDNSYPEQLMASLESSSAMDECPAVHFIISKEGVMVLNNESGFQEKDVRALCDVGRSTKGKHKYGYIGQKGIGFKSVFRVTSRPEVHSSGFHLCFDVDSGPMGYILPHWCPDPDPQQGWMTKIFLPLKEEMVSEARSLAARFNDIHPSLLLFLHRLRSIHIDNKVEGNQISMRRVDLGDNIVEIHHGMGRTDRWLVVKKQLDASAISLQAKSGIEVESTEIALAFPLQANWQQRQMAPAKQPVFAFLPLRSYGFRFIIQGDFDVPSSREDVDRDSSWNQWLRNEIHTLFIEAFDIFRSHPEFEGLQSLWSYLQFVPLEDEILDFFKPVATHVLQKLRATPCMPVVSASAGNKATIQWKLPSQTVMVQDSLVREVISPELLERHLGLHYVHRDVAAMLSPLLTRSLGVESITSDHLIQVGRSLVAAWGDTVGEDDVTQIAKWLACVYRSMDDFQENSTLISTLRGMKVIPLSTGQLVSLDEVTVFMLSDAGASSDKPAPGKRDPLSVLRQDLQLVHGGLTATGDNEVNSQVSKLLLKLDIKQLSAQDIVHHHILPILRSDQWQKKSMPVLVSYLVYIKEQRGRNNSLINMEELKAVARVLTNHGIKNPATENVHFSPGYGVGLDLRKHLPGYDWTLLDEQYLPASRAEVPSWQEFFSLLGVAKFLIVRQEEVKVKREEIDKTPWAPMKAMWPASQHTYLIQDYVCEELQQLVSNNTVPHAHKDQMKTLFTLLDSQWDSHYVKYSTTKLQSGSSDAVLNDSIPSSFAIALQTLRWLPGVESVVGSAAGVWRVEETETLLPPSLLYVPDPQIKQLLAHTAHYLAVNTSNTSSFIRFLRVKTTLDKSVVRDALVEWGKRDPKTPNEPAIFCTSLMHMKHVYNYLYENLPPKEAQDLFHQHQVIWVPQTEMVDRSHQRTGGRMLGREEVWWQDSSGLFLKYRPSLLEFRSPLADRHPVEHLYREIRETFTSAARMQQGPSQMDFAELLALISAAYNVREEGVLSDVLSIYARIGHYVTTTFEHNSLEMYQQKDQKEKVTNLLKNKKVLASKRQTWVSPADKPMLADDAELEKMFTGKEGVHFLTVDLPKSQQRGGAFQRRRFGAGARDTSQINVDDVLAFVALFNVPQLSEEMQKEEIPEMFVPCSSGQHYLHTIMPYVQRYLVASYPDVHDAHHQAGMAARLKGLLFVKTKKLQVRYTLKSLPDVYEIRDEKCVIMGTHFYFHEKYVESLFEVNKEVAHFFSDGNTDCFKDLRQFLMELQPLLEKNEERELRLMLDRNDVGTLPDMYLPWEVPLPVIPKPPTPPPPPPPLPVQQPVPAAAAGGAEGGDKGEGPTLRAWPPPAPGERRDNPNPNRKTGEGKPLGASIWPPPKAPEEVQRRLDLPSNIHMAPRESADSTPSDTDSASRSHSGHGTGSAHSEAGPGNHTSGSAHSGTGHAHSDQGRREMGERQMSHDGERGAGEGEGEGGAVLRRQDSGVPGKRKSDQLDTETSDSKRPAPDEGTGREESEGQRGEPGSLGHGGQGQAGAVGMATGQPDGNHNNQPRQPGSITRKGWPPYRPKPDHLQLPVWTQLASETEYEELGRGGDLKIPATLTLTESSNRIEIGRWGEQLVFDYLMQQKEMHGDIYDVIWTNEVEETGKPYDFEVICTSGDEAYTVYIEVKATRSSQKEVFEISANEVKFASEQGDHFHIYRIFNAGTTGQVQLVRLTNVSHKLDNKEVRLLMVI
ncbi:uncharacterized protein [Littorina saxatilis]|uniref:HTH OST-type domain-containing protein n=1 Tax=Littorina saxatilis TaxID=31220 RepID=A0AAN9GNW9_9CAEN